MTRKPDDVKKGLACAGLHTCPDEKCPYYASCAPCELQVQDDALALIQQLEAENAEQDWKIQQLEATVSEKEKVVAELSGKIGQLEAERDAAVADLEHVKDCDSCKYDDACFTGKKDCFGCHEKKCPCLTCQYEWRGVQKEE